MLSHTLKVLIIKINVGFVNQERWYGEPYGNLSTEFARNIYELCKII